MKRSRSFRYAATVASLLGGCASLLDLPSPTLDDTLGRSTVDAATDAVLIDGENAGDAAPPSDAQPDVPVDAGCDLSLLENCGACGVDCTGGECSKEGICTLAGRAASLDYPQGIAIFEDKIYIAVGGSNAIARCKTNGCAATGADIVYFAADAALGNFQPYRIVVSEDGGAVFWTNYTSWPTGGVYRTDTSSGATTMLNEGNPSHFATQLAIRDGLVIWGNDESPNPGGHYCPLSGCVGTPAESNSSAIRAVTALVANDRGIAFATEGTIQTCATPSCNPAHFPAATSQGPFIYGMALHGNDLFFSATFPAKQILRTEFALVPDGAPPTVVTEDPASNPEFATAALLVVNDTLYWADPGTSNPDGGNTTDGKIKKCQLPACTTVIEVAVGQAAPVSLATDGKAIYWANAGRYKESGHFGELRKAPL